MFENYRELNAAKDQGIETGTCFNKETGEPEYCFAKAVIGRLAIVTCANSHDEALRLLRHDLELNLKHD